MKMINWENFGIMHHRLVMNIADHYGPEYRLTGWDIANDNNDYGIDIGYRFSYYFNDDGTFTFHARVESPRTVRHVGYASMV